MFPDSTPGKLIFQPFKSVVPLCSSTTIAELVDVLHRPKLDKYVSETIRLELLTAYVSRSEFILPDVKIAACRDPRDNHVLELAVCGRADLIITGDKDLLALNPFEGIRILRPNEEW